MGRREWREEEISYLKDNYDKYTYKEIGKVLNRSRASVQNKIKTIGLKQPEKYFYNVNYFECIDSEHKAYWLGFIMADGYVRKTKRNIEIGIELQQRDDSHLKKLNKDLNGNVEIKYRSRPNHWNGNISNMCSIRFFRNKMYQDLFRYGVVENKSAIMQFPKINDDLKIHFIRGFFDGNGCVRLNKDRNCLCFDFCSASISMINSIKECLYSDYNISSYITQEVGVNRNIPCYRLNIKGLYNSYRFAQCLYHNATIYLDRKHDKYIQICRDFNIIKRLENRHFI